MNWNHRAVSAKCWVWLEGMRVLGGGVIVDADTLGFVLSGNASVRDGRGGNLFPDVRHPATKGCMVQILRDLYNDQRIATYPVKLTTGHWWNVGVPWTGELFLSTAQLEHEALVIAIELAELRK